MSRNFVYKGVQSDDTGVNNPSQPRQGVQSDDTGVNGPLLNPGRESSLMIQESMAPSQPRNGVQSDDTGLNGPLLNPGRESSLMIQVYCK
jgi:hypothetical protein